MKRFLTVFLSVLLVCTTLFTVKVISAEDEAAVEEIATETMTETAETVESDREDDQGIVESGTETVEESDPVTTEVSEDVAKENSDVVQEETKDTVQPETIPETSPRFSWLSPAPPRLRPW